MEVIGHRTVLKSTLDLRSDKLLATEMKRLLVSAHFARSLNWFDHPPVSEPAPLPLGCPPEAHFLLSGSR